MIGFAAIDRSPTSWSDRDSSGIKIIMVCISQIESHSETLSRTTKKNRCSKLEKIFFICFLFISN